MDGDDEIPEGSLAVDASHAGVERQPADRQRQPVDAVISIDEVEKSGAWYSYNGDRIGQGKENAKQFLREKGLVEVALHDDRMEQIPYDDPTDLVAITVETYTARRAYQIASEFRRRGVPVVMGGFHATLCPEEVARFAESIVVGEAEEVWPQVIDDFRHGSLQARYEGKPRIGLAGQACVWTYDRIIGLFNGS